LKKIFIALLLTVKLLSYSTQIDYGLSDSHGYLLKSGKLEFKLGYLRVNDQLDIFNLKDDELSNLSSDLRATIGNMSGLESSIRYGVNRKISLFLNYDYLAIDYFKDKLKDNRLDLFLRYNISTKTFATFNAISFDIGYRVSKADDIAVKDDFVLNYFLARLYPNSSFHFEDGSVATSSTKLTLYDKRGNKIYPAVEIRDLESLSPYIRLNTEIKISSYSLLNLYGSLSKNYISSEIGFYPENNDFLKDIYIDIPSLDREELTLESGFNYIYNYEDMLFEFGYEYSRVYREEPLKREYGSHSIDMSIVALLTREISLYMGGEILFQQFNSRIPYMYNRYTESQFDKKYGFAKFGIIYRLRGF